jgi:hypothetical protein
MMLPFDAVANTSELLAALTNALPREAAAAIAAVGLPVFPAHAVDRAGRCSCGSDCGRNAGKHPRTPSGFLDASTRLDQIHDWWQRWPGTNVAVVTGSGTGIWVLDIDPDNEGEATLANLEANYEELPPTWCVETGGGGLHLWYRYPNENLRNSVGLLGPGLDVRADGGYVIVPPSRHRSGEKYRWAPGWHPTSIPLAHAPDWLLDLVRQTSSQKMIPPDDPHMGGRLGGNQTQSLPAPIMEGTRNATLSRFAGSMRRLGFGEPAILAALLAENADRCSPPLAEAEVAKIAHSIARYAIACGAGPNLSQRRSAGFVEFIGGRAVVR